MGICPPAQELRKFSDLLTQNQYLHEDMIIISRDSRLRAHPMAMLSAMINAASCFDEGLMHWQLGDAEFDVYAARRFLKCGPWRRSHRKSLRAAADLPEGSLQVHGQLPAHAVLACRTKISI